ncbi:MAG TPA: MgtC/SapB family protein [Steroidobacteraceae bacterium]|nr:MgtC/SapB family protein [Steroidobacteraceae bacterium]
MSSGFEDIAHVPDLTQMVRIVIRLLAALLIGSVIGLQRELTHKPAGLRTHMLVGLGTALFVVAAAESGMSHSDLSRVVQGLATGIGFLGGGAILKLAQEREIHGLTTAAGIWMTAAAGAAAALGELAVAVIGVLLGLIVLTAFRRLEKELGHRAKKDSDEHPSGKRDPPDLL